MTVFLIIGAIGLALIVVTLVVGELFEGIVDGIFGDVDAGGVFSTPAIGAFLAAFGFGAALILYATSMGSGIAALGGLGAGLVVGGIAAAITRSLMNMNTDATVNTNDMISSTGSVITTIPEGGLGEVSVRFQGQVLKINARSQTALAPGTPVTVTAVTSPTSVIVEPTNITSTKKA